MKRRGRIEPPPSEEETMALRRQIAELPAEVADPEYRERLRRAFVAGQLAARAPSRRLPGRLILWSGGLLAAAAALLVVIRALAPAHPPVPWRLSPASGPPVAVVGDGVPLSLPAENGALEALLVDGGTLAAPDTLPVSLSLDGRLALQLAPGSRVRIPEVREGWRELTVRVEQGEARFTSGAGFAGRFLVVTTADSRVEVTGTTLAVIADSGGTCVCVLEGRVRVGRIGEAPAALEAGFRRVLHHGGEPATTEALRPLESMKLSMFRDQYAAPLNPESR